LVLSSSKENIVYILCSYCVEYAKILWNDCRTCFVFYVAMLRGLYYVVFLCTTLIFHMHHPAFLLLPKHFWDAKFLLIIRSPQHFIINLLENKPPKIVAQGFFLAFYSIGPHCYLVTMYCWYEEGLKLYNCSSSDLGWVVQSPIKLTHD